MATSRTGTTKYLKNSHRVKRQARASGLTNCPGWEGNGYTCGRELDYTTPLLPNSAESDHIIEHRRGGTDDVSNLRVLCRTCNLERNRKRPGQRVIDKYETSRRW